MPQIIQSGLPHAINTNPLADSQLTAAAISFTSTGDNDLVGAQAGQVIRVYKILVNVAGATSLTFKDGASTSLSGAMALAANQGIVLNFDGEPWFTTTAGNALILNQSGSVQVSGTVWYLQF